jgi:bacterioferritin
MARESVKILQGKLDVESLISQLNAALAEEWLAYYQYWVGALVVEGAMRADVQGEFEEHAEEERRHAQLLADRIIELEGVPVLDPKQWFELARCKYDSPTDFDVVSLLNQNVASERCAILRYQEIAKFTDGFEAMMYGALATFAGWFFYGLAAEKLFKHNHKSNVTLSAAADD